MIEIKKANLRDLDEIVSLHMCVFKNYYLTKLGSELLKKYYSVFFNSDDLQIVACENNKVVGFIIITVDYKSRMNEFYRTNLKIVSKVILKKVFSLNKTIIFGFIPRFKNLFKRVEVSEIGYSVSLLSIAVAKSNQNQGIARKMIEYCEQELIHKDVECYGLSVKAENSVAIRCYEKLGFEKSQEQGDLLRYCKKNFKENKVYE